MNKDNSNTEYIENKDQKILKNLTETNIDPSIQHILQSLISDKGNISLKTEINNPTALALLNLLGKWFKSKGYTTSFKTIDSFIQLYMEYMVSNKRKSRKEIIKALSSWIEKLSQNPEQLLQRKNL